ncbi:MAG: MOSC domain-containing protein [Candidatus Cloacimonetes bacterium]|nr:MOSC domain-containing protein [Candidatus Cloacimonadota bacterium]
MKNAIVQQINISKESQLNTYSVNSCEVVANQGIIGDRYYKETEDNEAAITFIEQEALDAIQIDYGVTLSAAESRRTILTRGVALNHLVGKVFYVGEVQCEGFELAEPCSHLEKLTNKKNLIKSLRHRGGLRARIKSSGTIEVGQKITFSK